MKHTLAYIVVGLLLMGSVAAIPFFTDRLNFPSGESRIHRQRIDLTGNITLTIPSGFNVTSASPGANISVNLTFRNVSSAVEFNMTSPSSCNESQLFVSRIFNNNALTGEFRFLCTPDSKIVDNKIEYGHGEGNYLDNTELFIPIDEATVFNLIRVFPLGHVLSPNRDMENATLHCEFPDRTIRTYGRVEVGHDFVNNRINGTFFWSLIDSGFWFRIGVISQDTREYNIGDRYNVSCTSLTYSLGTHQVQAPFTNYSILFVTKAPYTFTTFNDTSNPGNFILKVTNTQPYITRDVEFIFKVNNNTMNVAVPKVGPNESFFFRIPNTGMLNVSVFFMPPWLRNAFDDNKFVQQDASISPMNSPPILGSVGNQAIFLNQSFQLLVNGTDPDGDVFTFADNTTLFTINTTTGLLNFTNNGSFIGNLTINISIADSLGAQDFEIVIFEFLNVTNTTTQTNTTNTTNTTTSAPTSSGGGGGGGGYPGAIHGGGAVCSERWECGEWSACESYEQTRSCYDTNRCDTSARKPSTSIPCIPSGLVVVNVTFEPNCYDGVQNQDEGGIDCGGSCDACLALEMPAPLCGDRQCLFGELFACKADCAVPSFLLLLLLFGLFFIPIMYFEDKHYTEVKTRHEAMMGTLGLYLLLTLIAYTALTSVRQLTVVFWGVIVALTLVILYLFECQNR